MTLAVGNVVRRGWIVYLTLGAVASGVYMFAPGLKGSAPLFNLISASSAIAILVGVRIHRPAAAWVWRWFAIGQLLFCLGDVYTYSYPIVIGHDVPFPSPGDGLYLLVYPALMTGVLLAVRRRNPQGDRAGVIDAFIITVGIALLSWVFLMAPYVHDATLSPLAKMVSIAYPLGDVLLLAAALRLAFDGGRRRGSFFLLAASVGALLATDAGYGFALLDGSYDHQLIYDAGWLAYYLLWGAAALHPSMQNFVEATPDRERRLSWQRLGLLTVASLVAPAIELVREARRGDVDLLVIVAASIVVFLFVIARVVGLVKQNERTVLRERALRLANLALVKATTPAEIGAAALRTAQLLVGGVGDVRLCVQRPAGLVLLAASPAAGQEAALPPSTVALLEQAATTPDDHVALPPAVHVELDLPPGSVRANVFPLAAREDRRGLLIAAASTPFSPILVDALDALSASVSLALESAALIEQAHRRENEARFASLVRNASDLITVVDRDGRVIYQSPSIHRILGLSADEVSGTLFEDLLVSTDRGRLRKVLQSAGHGAPRSHTFDCTLTHRDGRALKFEVVATDLLDDEHVRGIVLNGRDASERAAFEEQLAHQAFHDTVTGLPNRALFGDRVEHALVRAAREGTSIAVIFLDLDDFKTINDSLGHAAGDEVLRQVGTRLLDSVRTTDTAARFGGDEFAILLEDVSDPAMAIDLAERIVRSFEMPISVVDKDLAVRPSIGIAVSGADAEEAPSDADELIRNADAAMYICKRDGKGGYRVFEAAMHERVLERLELRVELQRAIDEGQFELHFQPVVRLHDGRVAGMEALVRWHHPTRGLVQPGQFIPLAEEMGLIVDLGRWVLNQACQQAARLSATGETGPEFSISVNLSVKQLQHPDVVADVRAALEVSGINPRMLVLEITETVMMADYELASRRLGQLKDLGVRIAMDDFGTGYSSLSYLSRFPVDILKMDRSFLASDASPQAAGLAAAIVALGESLKLEVVAEGIELSGQYDSLRALGCDLGQGFFIARPMDVATTREWLADEADRAARADDDADAA
jgi:diguanylate cyclase (GGDEF)-like protein/PAS domain S-box-containing protein